MILHRHRHLHLFTFIFFPRYISLFSSTPSSFHHLNGIKFRKSNVSSIFRCTHSSQTAPMAAVLFCSHDTVVFFHFRHANAENSKNKTHVPRIISTAVIAIWRKNFFPSDSILMRICLIGRSNFMKSYKTAKSDKSCFNSSHKINQQMKYYMYLEYYYSKNIELNFLVFSKFTDTSKRVKFKG